MNLLGFSVGIVGHLLKSDGQHSNSCTESSQQAPKFFMPPNPEPSGVIYRDCMCDLYLKSQLLHLENSVHTEPKKKAQMSIDRGQPSKQSPLQERTRLVWPDTSYIYKTKKRQVFNSQQCNILIVVQDLRYCSSTKLLLHHLAGNYMVMQQYQIITVSTTMNKLELRRCL
jgi:hypothetical protein